MRRILITGLLIAFSAEARATRSAGDFGTAGLPATEPLAGKQKPALPPVPSPAETKAIIDEIRQNSLKYTKNLPDYICTQITRRHIDYGQGWRDAGMILEELSFFEQTENYKVLMVNGVVITRYLKHDQLGGATSSGEFGGILQTIFSRQTLPLWHRNVAK